MKFSKIFILGLGFITVFSPKAEAAQRVKASLSKGAVKQGETVKLSYSLLSATSRRLAADSVTLKRYSNATCSTFVEDVATVSSLNGTMGSKEFSIAAPGQIYLKAVKDGYSDSSCLSLTVLNTGAEFEKLVVKRDSEFDGKIPYRLEWKNNSDVFSAGSTEKVKISLYSDSSCQTKIPRVRELSVSPKNGQAQFTLLQPAADRFAKAVSANGISSSCFIVPKDFVSGLEHETSALDASYEANGVVQWEDFKANQELHKNKVVEVDQADFASGTLRIKKPLKLKFKENVAFNPNRPELLPDGKIDPNRSMDWFPMGPIAQPEYYEASVARAYGMGFFAAIAIESEGVVVDLNQKTLSMHPEFAIMQQFYSHIELSSQPFAPANGPFDFGDDLTAARKVWIKNGVFDNSTHQAIHGNNNTDVRISGITINDYSVAGISLNGSERVVIKSTSMSGGRPTKVLGAFNSIRLETKLVQGYKAAKGGVISSELQAAHDAAKLAVEKVFNDIMSTGSVREHDPLDSTTLAAKDVAVIKNTANLSDAIAYGIVINPAGNATGKFMEQREKSRFGVLSRKPAKIFIGDGTVIKNVTSAVREVMAMSPAIDESQEFTLADGTAGYNVNAQMRGATGAVLDYERVFNLASPYLGGGLVNTEFGKYVGNVISDLQIELAATQNAEPSTALKARLGQINMEPAFIEMKRGTEVGQKLRFLPIGLAEPLDAAAEGDRVWLLVDATVNTDPAHTPFGEPVASDIVPGDTRGLGELEFVALANGDIQHHVLKGNLGIRIEGSTGVTLDGVSLGDGVSPGVSNHGALGYEYTNFETDQAIGWYDDATGGHGAQGAMRGYFGNHSRGLSFAACTDVAIKNTVVNGVVSHTGPAIGIDVKNDTQGLVFTNVSVGGVLGGSELTSAEATELGLTDKTPNWSPVSVDYLKDASSTATGVPSVL
jgi:hypothetical protein